MNEIEVLVKQETGAVKISNYDEIKMALADQMSVYGSLQFTEDQKAVAKKDVATLRKMKTAIDNKRKEVKKDFMKPYDEFDGKVKELIKLIDEPIELINQQVSEFDAKVKAEKQEKIKEIYAETIGDMKELLPLEKIYKKTWENTATSAKSIKTDLTDLMFQTEQDIKILQNFNSDGFERAKEMYLSNYKVNEAIAYIQQYEQQKKEMLEKEQARKEAEAKRLEEKKKRLEEEKLVPQKSKKKPLHIQEEANTEFGGFSFPVEEEPQGFSFAEEEPEQTATFTVTGTAEQIRILREYIHTTFDNYREA